MEEPPGEMELDTTIPVMDSMLVQEAGALIRHHTKVVKAVMV